MDDFLKRMQDALEHGQQDDELKKYINEIEKKADGVDDPEKAWKKRVEDVGERELTDDEKKMNEKTPEELQEYNDTVMAKISEEDEKWAKLAHLENLKIQLNRINSEYKELKEKYEKSLNKIEKNIDKLKKEFIEKYGEDDLNKLK